MKKFTLFLGIVMVLLLIVTGCTQQAADTSTDSLSEGKRDDVIVYVEGVWKTLNPHESTTFVDMYLFNQLYEALTIIDDDGNINECLAKEWSVSDDNLTYTFKLEEGVKFHNGEELKANDVVFSYKNAIDSPSMLTYVSMIDTVEAVDDYTVNIKLKNVYSSFLANTAEIMIMNEKFSTEKGDLIREEACGTGPYKLVSFDMNTETNMTRFDEYRLGPASIKDVKFKVITEATTAMVSFESGELDFAMAMNPSSYANIEASGKFNTKLLPTLHTAYIVMNNTKAPFDNKLVRQALNYAADKETMIAIAYEGLAVPAKLLAAENSFGVDFSDAKEYNYDLEKAKALLAEAGYPNGLDLGTMTLIGGYHEKIAQVFQQSLAEIGCTLELQMSETTVSDVSAGNFTIANMGHGYTNDFAYDSRYYTTSGIYSGNMSQYSNPKVDELFLAADMTLDREERKEYYKEAISIITDDAPIIPIFHKQIPYVWNKDLNAVPHLSSARPWYIYEWSWN
ncbi:MAG: ABC transporter substrate-binding protein [Sedimentibacter sp.]